MAAKVTRLKPSTIKAAAAAGRRDLLVALRDKISQELDEGVPARDLASLSLRLIALSEQIESLDNEEAQTADATGDEDWDADAI